jgi:hypothetical protein
MISNPTALRIQHNQSWPSLLACSNQPLHLAQNHKFNTHQGLVMRRPSGYALLGQFLETGLVRQFGG